MTDKFPKPRILLVNNDSAQRDSLAHPLIELGYQVQAAADGTSALEIAARIYPDIILAQRDMPFMNGLTLCQKVKSNEAIPRCHFVLIVSKISDIVDIGRSTEPDDYLTEPVTLFELSSRIRNGYNALNYLRSEQKSQEITASKMIEQASHLIFEKSASVLRHEINNPLFAISGSADGLIRLIHKNPVSPGIDTKDLLIRLGRIISGAERIREVVAGYNYKKIITDQMQSDEMNYDIKEAA